MSKYYKMKRFKEKTNFHYILASKKYFPKVLIDFYRVVFREEIDLIIHILFLICFIFVNINWNYV
jgi:hypothetical protein